MKLCALLAIIFLYYSHFNFWVKMDNFFNAPHHSSAVRDSYYSISTSQGKYCIVLAIDTCQYPVNRTKTIQKNPKEMAGLMLEITSSNWNLNCISDNLLSPIQNKQKHHTYCLGQQVHSNTVRPL